MLVGFFIARQASFPRDSNSLVLVASVPVAPILTADLRSLSSKVVAGHPRQGRGTFSAARSGSASPGRVDLPPDSNSYSWFL